MTFTTPNERDPTHFLNTSKESPHVSTSSCCRARLPRPKMAPFARERSPSPTSGPGERGVASSTTFPPSGVPAAVELGANRSCAVAFASGTTHFDRGRAARRPRPRP